MGTVGGCAGAEPDHLGQLWSSVSSPRKPDKTALMCGFHDGTPGGCLEQRPAYSSEHGPAATASNSAWLCFVPLCGRKPAPLSPNSWARCRV